MDVKQAQRLNSTVDPEADDGDDITRYREQFGSGIVNTRISDRESEVLLLVLFSISSNFLLYSSTKLVELESFHQVVEMPLKIRQMHEVTKIL